MDKLIINQSMNLRGEIRISGAKNAALPIMCAALLTADELKLTNVPKLKDIYTLQNLLAQMGVSINYQENAMNLIADKVDNLQAPYELVKTMRASILVLGPLLSRFGYAEVSLPGGCAIGARPVDQHIKGLEAMGAEIIIEHGYIKAKASKLKGTEITMDIITVTGTENLLMAAVLADGVTILNNAACEPEVTDLAECLIKMGAKIEGLRTNRLVIHGVSKLHGAEHDILPDRIEAGTFAVAAAITRSQIKLTNARPFTMRAIMDKLFEAKVSMEYNHDYLEIKAMKARPKAVNIKTEAYHGFPTYSGFPTDMQAQFMLLNCIAHGEGKLTETIFENRFMHVPELCRMGADIVVEGNTATTRGVSKLHGANVMATDLRASASLVLAGLFAEGQTTIERIYHLDRGYEAIEDKLTAVGANVVRIKA